MDLREFSLIEHLRELKKIIVRSAWGIFAGMLLVYHFTEVIFDFLRAPIAKYLPTSGLVFTAPMDKFMAHLKIAFFGGIILSCPWWLYQIWQFVSPGLYSREKKYAASFIISGSSLFLIGLAFSYYLVLPAAFEFLMNFGGSVDKPMITIDHYLSFILTTSAMFGVVFEMPLVLVLLGLMGFVSADFLRQKRRVAVVVLAFAAAVLTPAPDALSMVMMLVPMIGLYEVSIIIIAIMEKKKKSASN